MTQDERHQYNKAVELCQKLGWYITPDGKRANPNTPNAIPDLDQLNEKATWDGHTWKPRFLRKKWQR